MRFMFVNWIEASGGGDVVLESLLLDIGKTEGVLYGGQEGQNK